MDQVFSGSRFVLTIRPDARVWFESLLEFHTTVVDYFSYRPEDLLVLDVAKPHALERLC